MKLISINILILLFSFTLSGQNLDNKYLSHVVSEDDIIQSLYEVISGDKSTPRNWELFRYLFKENAQLISTRKSTEDIDEVTYMSVEEYIERAEPYFKQSNFFEKEIHRKTEKFGPLTHIFSTYITLDEKLSKTPVARGINSIQLLNDGKRWWIINIYWVSETKSNPIPEQYLPQ